MKKTFFSVFFGVVISAAIFVSAIVFAQDKITALVQPLIVDIQHSVPVLAEVVVPLKDGTTVTATVPLTINVALQVSLSGIVSDSVEVVEKIEPAITVLGRVVTAKQIGDNNSPIEITNSFSSTDDLIYVTAEADFVPKDTIFFARWSLNGEPFADSSELTADRDYTDTYIEFHLENLEAELETGDYSVQIFVNGNLAEEVDFTVSAFAAETLDEPVIGEVYWTLVEVEHLAPEMNLGIQVNFETLGEFLLLHFELKNIGQQPISIDYSNNGDLSVELVDDQERVFAPYKTGYQIPDLCESAEINPSLTVACIIPFEIPKDVPNLRLRLMQSKEGTERQIIEVDLPIDSPK